MLKNGLGSVEVNEYIQMLITDVAYGYRISKSKQKLWLSKYDVK